MNEKEQSKSENEKNALRKIKEDLFSLQDENYRNFHAKLMPEIPFDRIIGVRMPDLRNYAKKAAKLPDISYFLCALPHDYYEENNLHGALLSILYKDLETYLEQLEAFLPYVDNWATCDMIGPKIFKKNLPLVYENVKQWLKSGHVYTVRFGVVTLLQFFLDEAFEPEMLNLAAEIESEEYYVKMAVAWYFSIALVKQYEAAIPYIEQNILQPWTHNKAIQKAIESRRIDAQVKEYLRSLKVRVLKS